MSGPGFSNQKQKVDTGVNATVGTKAVPSESGDVKGIQGNAVRESDNSRFPGPVDGVAERKFAVFLRHEIQMKATERSQQYMQSLSGGENIQRDAPPRKTESDLDKAVRLGALTGEEAAYLKKKEGALEGDIATRMKITGGAFLQAEWARSSIDSFFLETHNSSRPAPEVVRHYDILAAMKNSGFFTREELQYQQKLMESPDESRISLARNAMKLFADERRDELMSVRDGMASALKVIFPGRVLSASKKGE